MPNLTDKVITYTLKEDFSGWFSDTFNTDCKKQRPEDISRICDDYSIEKFGKHFLSFIKEHSISIIAYNLWRLISDKQYSESMQGVRDYILSKLDVNSEDEINKLYFAALNNVCPKSKETEVKREITDKQVDEFVNHLWRIVEKYSILFDEVKLYDALDRTRHKRIVSDRVDHILNYLNIEKK